MLLASVVLTACGGQAFPAASEPAPTTQTFASVPSPDAAALDTTIVRSDALTSADVGSGWTVVAEAAEADASSASHCSPDAVLPPFTTVETEDLSYGLRDGAEAGHLQLIVSVSRTAAEIDQRIRMVEQQPDFAACTKAGVIENQRDAAGAGGSVEGATIAELARPPVAGVTNSYRSVVQYHFAGQAKTAFVDEFYVERGRALVLLVFNKCCQAFSPAFETRVLQLVDARLQPDFG